MPASKLVSGGATRFRIDFSRSALMGVFDVAVDIDAHCLPPSQLCSSQTSPPVQIRHSFLSPANHVGERPR